MSKTDENYLQKLFINEAKPALNRHSGGGDNTPTTPTDNRISLSYWYQYLAGQFMWAYDWDTDESYLEGEPVVLEFPTGTQNVTSASKFLNVFAFYEVNGCEADSKLPVKKFTGTLDLSGLKVITLLMMKENA